LDSLYIGIRIQSIAAWAGLPAGVSGYSLRRSGATLAYLSGVGGAEIAARLRHSTLDSTVRYLDLILDEKGREAWLSADIPSGWNPEVRTLVTGAVWTEAGPLEEVVAEAVALALEETVAVAPSTRRIYNAKIVNWKTAAQRTGIEPERPMPEDFALYLASEVDRGLNPRSLRGHIGAVEWWFATLGRPQPAVIATARAVADALQKSSPAAPRVRRAPSVSVTALAEIIDQRAPEAWRLQLAVVARHLDMRMVEAARIESSSAVLGGSEATLIVAGKTKHIVAEVDELTCPVRALDGLVQRRPVGPLATREEAQSLRTVIGQRTRPGEPSLMNEQTWHEIVQLLARHERVQRRLDAGVRLGLAGLLGTDETLALRWEHMHRHPLGFVVRGSDAYPLRASLEGRLFLAREDVLDLEPALIRLAAAWPWPGGGLFGCSGFVISDMHRTGRSGESAALTPGCWTTHVREAGQRVGIKVTPRSIRVAGAHEDWAAHQDEFRLQRRMGFVYPSATRLFLRNEGILAATATDPEGA